MEKQMYIVIGRSGCGKGTQADLLKEYLEKKGIENVIHVTTGGGFRAFIETDSFVASKSREVESVGGLQPEFLAIWNWTNTFIKTLKGNDTVILDGAPRMLIEVSALKSAVPFLGYKKATVIYLDVGEGWAIDRLLSRGREDDKNIESVKRRLAWFIEHVYPCVEAFEKDEAYNFIRVNGEQTIEQVQAELISKLENLI